MAAKSLLLKCRVVEEPFRNRAEMPPNCLSSPTLNTDRLFYVFGEISLNPFRFSVIGRNRTSQNVSGYTNTPDVRTRTTESLNFNRYIPACLFTNRYRKDSHVVRALPAAFKRGRKRVRTPVHSGVSEEVRTNDLAFFFYARRPNEYIIIFTVIYLYSINFTTYREKKNRIRLPRASGAARGPLQQPRCLS